MLDDFLPILRQGLQGYRGLVSYTQMPDLHSLHQLGLIKLWHYNYKHGNLYHVDFETTEDGRKVLDGTEA